MESVHRNWGWYHVLYEGDTYRVKLLQIDPGSALSNQYHNHRSETWRVVKGEVHMLLFDPAKDSEPREIILEEGSSLTIDVGCWHKASNRTDKPAEVVEIWAGDQLSEEDIVRQGQR